MPLVEDGPRPDSATEGAVDPATAAAYWKKTSSLMWTVLAVLVLAFPAYVQVARSLSSRLRGVRIRDHITAERDNVVTSNISSSLVRERGRNYEHAKLLALVPDVVWDYLVEHRLLDPEVLQ